MIFFLLIVLFYSLLVNSFFGFKIPKKNTRKNEWFIYFPISLSLSRSVLCAKCNWQDSIQKNKNNLLMKRQTREQDEWGRRRLGSNSKNVKKVNQSFSNENSCSRHSLSLDQLSRSLQLGVAFHFFIHLLLLLPLMLRWFASSIKLQTFKFELAVIAIRLFVSVSVYLCLIVKFFLSVWVWVCVCVLLQNHWIYGIFL